MLDKATIKNYLQNIKINSDALEASLLFAFIEDVCSYTASGYNKVYIPIIIILNALFVFIYIKNEKAIEASTRTYCFYASIIMFKAVISSSMITYAAFSSQFGISIYIFLIFVFSLIIVGILSFVIYAFFAPKSSKRNKGALAAVTTPSVTIGAALGILISRSIENTDYKIIIVGYASMFISFFIMIAAMRFLSQAYLFSRLENTK